MKLIWTLLMMVVLVPNALARHAKISELHATQFSRFQHLHWYRVVDADNVHIHVNVVKEPTLKRMIEKYSNSPNWARHDLGFAVLFRNSTTGAYVCQIYVLNTHDKATLAHERFHCHGWQHREP